MAHLGHLVTLTALVVGVGIVVAAALVATEVAVGVVVILIPAAFVETSGAQAKRPSAHVCSLSSSLPHFPYQVPDCAQQFSTPLQLTPQMGHFGVVIS